MIFPKPDEYNAAVQNPKVCFSDDDLRNGRVQQNSMGLPFPYSGGFTTTYKVFTDNTTYAARCFIRDVRNLVARYSAIGDFRLHSKCPYLVDADVLKNGILVGGKWHPIIKMRWVEGDLLNVFLEKTINQNKGELEVFLAKFEEFAHQLEKDEFAHGDLQHGNILIRNDRIYLIDYDGVYVPEIESLGTGEVGHPNYQHPARTTKNFDRNLDRFSVIVIWLSIKILLYKKNFWQKYNNGENLIFLREDFRDPKSSNIFYELSQVPELKEDVLKFAAICNEDFEKVPPLHGFIDGGFSYIKPTLKKPAKARRVITSKEQDVFNNLYGAASQVGVKTSSGAFRYTPTTTLSGGATTVPPTTPTSTQSQPVYSAPTPIPAPQNRSKWLIWAALIFVGIIILSSLTDTGTPSYQQQPTSIGSPNNYVSDTSVVTCPAGYVKSSITQKCVTRDKNCEETEGAGSVWDGNFCTSPCTAYQCQLANGTCVSKPINSSCIADAATKYSSWKCDSGYYEVKSTSGDIDCHNAISMNSSCNSSQTNSRWDGSDPKGGKINCVCSTGYTSNSITFGSPGSACVVEVQKSASELCQDKYGPNTYSDGTYCQCNSGYEWNSSQTACTAKITAEQRNQSCSTKWPKSIWDGTYCDCPAGYNWNTSQTACVLSNAAQWCQSNNPGYYTDVSYYPNGNFSCSCYGTPAGSEGRTAFGCNSPQ